MLEDITVGILSSIATAVILGGMATFAIFWVPLLARLWVEWWADRYPESADALRWQFHEEMQVNTRVSRVTRAISFIWNVPVFARAQAIAERRASSMTRGLTPAFGHFDFDDDYAYLHLTDDGVRELIAAATLPPLERTPQQLALAASVNEHCEHLGHLLWHGDLPQEADEEFADALNALAHGVTIAEWQALPKSDELCPGSGQPVPRRERR